MTTRAVCLMGPTASGKTGIAVDLVERLPCDIVSVDSALVYRGMDIGTAKPDAETLNRAPHRLIDIREPEQAYSAGDFVTDARAAIHEIAAAGRVPLLVGGTMMYFRALTEGIADLPPADAQIRADIDAQAARVGWPAMHERLAESDPDAARRINPNDSQRIQRALEVLAISGRKLSEWQKDTSKADDDALEFIKLGLVIEPRAVLHDRIARRLKTMINSGLEDEVKSLMSRDGLTSEHASMRSVGYRQFWACLEGRISRDEAADRALYATRQLAKRQITWMRSESSLTCFDALDSGTTDAIIETIRARTL